MTTTYPYGLVPNISKPIMTYPRTLKMSMPLFSDNSRVYYTSGSLGSGIGSVVNSRAKRRMT